LGEERENNKKEKKLGSRKIYIDNDLRTTQEERDVQRKLREITEGEKADEGVGYRRIEIES